MTSGLRKKTQATIEAVHSLFDDCQLAMLVDQETGLVLCKSASSFVPQNKLEQLAEDIQIQIRSALAQSLSNTRQSPDMLVLTKFTNDGVVAVVQDLRSCEDALVCQFAKTPDRAQLMGVADRVFGLSMKAEAA